MKVCIVFNEMILIKSINVQFRITILNHNLLKYIQIRLEIDLRSWVYLMPPMDEKDGHEMMGSLAVWQLIKQTDHFICQTGATCANM